METITQPDSWLGVELRHLAALEAVAREGSFGRAAAKLGYTQSAVSQQIASLERSVGEKLVERPGGPRAVSLTEAGELLLRHAEAIVARLDAARADMASLRAGETGTLRVGTYQSVGARVLPAVMRRFRNDHPGINLELHEPTTDPELFTLIESGDLDLAFCSLPLPDGPFDGVELMRDPYVLVVSAEHELSSSRLRLPRRPRRPAADRLADVRERRPPGRGTTRAWLRRRLRVPLGRQRHRSGPGGRRLRSCVDTACSRCCRETSASRCFGSRPPSRRA